MNSKIFISYRREDSSWSTGRIYDNLARHFSEEQLFIDVNSIAPGDDFVSYIEAYVNNCAVLLAVIGQHWLKTIQSKAGETDFVRLEIAAALKKDVWVIPILVEDTKMPVAKDLPDELQGLTRRNYFTVNHASFNSAMKTLVENIQKILSQKEAKLEEEQQRKKEEEAQQKQKDLKHEKQQITGIKGFLDKQRLINNLKRLITEGDKGNFLIVSSKHIYVQFAGMKGEPLVQCETVSNEFLPKNFKLKEEQITKLTALGFNKPGNTNSNFYIQQYLNNDDDFEYLSEITGAVFFDVHALPEDTQLSFKLTLE